MTRRPRERLRRAGGGVVFRASSDAFARSRLPPFIASLLSRLPHAAVPRIGFGIGFGFGLAPAAVRVVTSVLIVAFAPRGIAAQQGDSVPRLGLAASSAFSLHAGVAQFRHATLGTEVGVALDLGWLRSRSVRLSLGIDYLATTIDRADALGVRERGSGYVFTAFTDVTAMMPLVRRMTPYAGVGFGVDAVGTTIANEQVGAIYNTNVFNLHAQAGALFYLTPRRRFQAEARATGARTVRRYAVRIGYVWLFNGLP